MSAQVITWADILNINYYSMKKEIISKIEALTQEESLLNLSKQFSELTNEFYNIVKEEDRAWEIEKLERIEAGEKPEAVENKVDEDFDVFKNVVSAFKAKRQPLIGSSLSK